jgi:uncharacterized protein YcfJ
MISPETRFIAALLTALTASGNAVAQSYYDDQACREYAGQQTAGLQNQANSQAVGGALVGAGLGAALGAAIGGGRGAGIGAASGAIAGTGVGVANAQNTSGYAQQQYNAYYAQCMQARQSPPPAYQPGYGNAPVAGYAPPAGYASQPGYGPTPAAPPSSYSSGYPSPYR